MSGVFLGEILSPGPTEVIINKHLGGEFYFYVETLLKGKAKGCEQMKSELDVNWMKEIIKNIREGVLVVDRNLNVLYINQSATRIGLQVESIVGKTLFEVFPLLKKEQSTILKALKTGLPIIDQVQTFVTYRGERKTTLTSTYPIKVNNEVIGIIEIFEDISALSNLSDQVIELQKKQKVHYSHKNEQANRELAFSEFIGQSPAILHLKQQLPILAKSPSPIFIYGETGTGKEVVVKNIHMLAHENRPLITQNCAAIPDNLLESILFGTVKGSFTDAENRQGLFELAHGGILFLDEINSLSKPVQAKLLRVLQEKKVRRVGSTNEIPVDVRLIAATNVHPNELLKQNEIRQDLYYRLNVLYLELPPLRQRRSDFPLLIAYFLQEYNALFAKRVIGISREVEEYFESYDWPGNIRELKNIIERAMNLVNGDLITLEDIQTTQFLSLSSNKEEDYSRTRSKQS